MTTERNAQGVDVLASDREMIRWLNGDVLTVLLDVSNEISSPGQQSMARGAIRRVEAIIDRLRSHGEAIRELVEAVRCVYGDAPPECTAPCPSCDIRAALAKFPEPRP